MNLIRPNRDARKRTGRTLEVAKQTVSAVDLSEAKNLALIRSFYAKTRSEILRFAQDDSKWAGRGARTGFVGPRPLGRKKSCPDESGHSSSMARWPDRGVAGT